MRNVKYMLDYFSFYDRDGIEKFLQKQAAKGWLLDSLSSHVWKFRRIEPSKVHFSVVYFAKEKRSSDISSQMAEFARYCAATGWHLVESKASRQIYYNTEPDPIPIETDFVTKDKKLIEASKKLFLVREIITFLIALSLLILGVFGLKMGRLEFYLNDLYYVFLSAGPIVMLSLLDLLCFLITFLRISRNTEPDKHIATLGISPTVRGLFFVWIFVQLWLFVSLHSALLIIGALVIFAALVMTVIFVKNWLWWRLDWIDIDWIEEDGIMHAVIEDILLFLSVVLLGTILCLFTAGFIEVDDYFNNRNHVAILSETQVPEGAEIVEKQYKKNVFLLYNKTTYRQNGEDGSEIRYYFRNSQAEGVLEAWDMEKLHEGLQPLDHTFHNVDAIYYNEGNGYSLHRYYITFDACRLELEMNYTLSTSELCEIIETFREYAISH